MPVVVPLHDDIGKAMPQDRVPAVEEFSAQQRPFQLKNRWHHQGRHLPEIHSRQSRFQDLRLHLPRHMRVEGDFLNVQVFAEVDQLCFDFLIVDY